jgi:hypothetical protein
MELQKELVRLCYTLYIQFALMFVAKLIAVETTNLCNVKGFKASS